LGTVHPPAGACAAGLAVQKVEQMLLQLDVRQAALEWPVSVGFQDSGDVDQ